MLLDKIHHFYQFIQMLYGDKNRGLVIMTQWWRHSDDCDVTDADITR